MAEPGLIRLATALAAAGITVPVIVDGRNAGNGGSEHFRSRGPARIRGVRAGTTGTVEVMGADLVNPDIGSVHAHVIGKGDGVTVAFQSTMDYVAPSKNPLNWIAVPNWLADTKTILTGAGSAATGVDVAITNVGGKALCTFHADDTPPAGAKVALFALTAEQLLAAVGLTEHASIRTRDLMWCEGTGATVNSTDVWLEAIAGVGVGG